MDMLVTLEQIERLWEQIKGVKEVRSVKELSGTKKIDDPVTQAKKLFQKLFGLKQDLSWSRLVGRVGRLGLGVHIKVAR